MPDRIAAKGHTHVVLLVNMTRFIADDEERERFESCRGRRDFADALRLNWPTAVSAHSPFSLASHDGMSVDDVGFATGVFRSLMLRRLTSPVFCLDKDRVHFPADLENNFQFKTLFKRAWNRWAVTIRPTMTGFFVVGLTYDYRQSPRALIDLAKDAIKLQEPLDVPSAVRWLQYNRERYEQQPETLQVKERSVRELLRWLGADVDNPQASETLYYPVQWKLALEAVNLFVENGRFTIPHHDGDILLQKAPPTLAMPLHDSYVIYHFDELLAEPGVLNKKKQNKAAAGVKVPVTLNDVRNSKKLRNVLASLLEGTVLRDPDKPDDELDSNGYFPSPRWSNADNLIKENLASWSDELCLFTPRTALVLPSSKWLHHEMAVSTVPGATLKVKYGRYWEAISRMIEFVLEVRVLAQLIESESYRLLTEIAETIEKIRAEMFNGDIEINQDLQGQLSRAAHLGRVASLAQSVSHAQYWSRAEYAVEKADRLLGLLDVPQIFEHIDRNINSINAIADHVDELYLADLSEKSNDKATMLSLGVAAISLIVTFLAVPSFWVDLWSVDGAWSAPDWFYLPILFMGTALAVGVSLISLALLIMAVKRQGWRKLSRQLFNLDTAVSE